MYIRDKILQSAIVRNERIDDDIHYKKDLRKI